jgi:hypothetical protein
LKTVTIDSVTYRIPATERDGKWVARAERADTGDRYGIECTGASPDEAADSVAGWLEWQHDHAAALEDLQLAERAYHRTIAGSAFASPTEGPSPIEMQKESLEAVEAARVRLDEIRARRPESQ